MKKKVIAGSLALLAVTAMHAQTYQLPNVGFENWKGKCDATFFTENSSWDSNTPGNEPSSWYSSNIQFGVYKAETVTKQPESNPNFARITNLLTGATIPSVQRNGLLSLGQNWYTIYGSGTNLGGNNAANVFAQNGCFGGVEFTGRPDAIYGTFRKQEKNNKTEDFHLVAYTWTGTIKGDVPGALTYSGNIFSGFTGKIKNWCTLENADRAIIGSVKPSIINENTVRNIDAKNGNVIAWADYTESGSFDWKPITVELKYISDDAPALTNVIISAGNIWDSRAAVTDNYIDADNVRYAYFSRLSNASIDGYAFDFNPNTLDYIITVNDVENFTLPTGVNYSIMSNEALTADKEATVSSINDNKQISIKVTNKQSIANAEATDADGLREHTYNFYFREAPQQFEGFYFTNVNGTDIYSGETTTLTLTQENADYHTYTLAIANVKVAQAATRAAGDAVNVTVSGLTKTEKDGKVIYSGTDNNAKVGNKPKQVSAVATFDGDNYEVKFSFTNEDGTVTNVVATPEPTTSSVSEINGATAAVAATEGAILVSNYNGAAAVYTTDGRLAANAEVNGSASINVAAGLYIVRTGNKATKVIVK